MPLQPAALLEPFRIANQYGLFAVMTRGRYEIEFQGSNDGQNWEPYLFTHKPQALNEAPGIYAPYQPRFDWNLWFASLGDWQQNDMVPITEEKLLENDRDVIGLFRSDPFDGKAAAAGARGTVAVLVYEHGGEAANRRLVEAAIPGACMRRRCSAALTGDFEVVAPPDDLPEHD